MLTGLTGIRGGAKAAALAMAFKLIESAQRRWRMVNAPHLDELFRSVPGFGDIGIASRFRTVSVPAEGCRVRIQAASEMATFR